jgi:hypothetical protein
VVWLFTQTANTTAEQMALLLLLLQVPQGL